MRYIINGPANIDGCLKISGAKNFSIKALAASLLASGESYYHNIPDNLDVHRTLNMLKSIGAVVEFDQEKKICSIDSSNVSCELFDATNANMMTFLLGAALMHRFDYVKFPKHKGCPLGKRLVDFHIMVFEAFGIQYENTEEFYALRKNSIINDAIINLPYPSVGATETALFLAVRSHGVVHIHNAAIEPEVQALVTMFITMGARIFYEGDRDIKIYGVPELVPMQRADIHADLLEVGTWAVLAAVTNGSIIVTDIVPEMIGSFLGVFSMLGGGVERIDMHSLRFFKNKYKVPCNVAFETGVFPALRTDMQPILAALAGLNQDSTTVIHETVYNNRLDYIDFFNEFGIKAIAFEECLGNKCRFSDCSLHSVIITGAEKLKVPSRNLVAKTIRSGMAQIILACVAQGQTVIEDVEIIERGYCNLFSKLKSLGVDIQRIE